MSKFPVRDGSYRNGDGDVIELSGDIMRFYPDDRPTHIAIKVNVGLAVTNELLEGVSVLVRLDLNTGVKGVRTSTGRYTTNPEHFNLYATPGKASSAKAQQEKAVAFREEDFYVFEVVPLYRIKEVLNG